MQPVNELNAPAIVPSAALYRAIFEEAADGIFVTDPAGRFVDVNPQACRMLGYSRAELLAQPVLELLPPIALINQPIRLAELRSGKPVQSKRRLRRKDGALVLVEIRTKQLNDGHLLSIARDLPEDETVEETLRESEEWLRLAHDAAELGNWRFHILTRQLYLDGRASQHYGLATDVIALDDLFNQIHPADLAQIQQTFTALAGPTNTGRQSMEYRIIHPDGMVRWLAVQARVYYSGEAAARQPVLVAGISQDITAQKALEQQLQAHNQQLTLFAELSNLLAQSSQDYQVLLDVAVRAIANAFQGGALIHLLSSEGDSLQRLALFDADPEVMALLQATLAALPLRTAESFLSRQLLHSGKPFFMPAFDPVYLRTVVHPAFFSLVDQLSLQSLLAVPLQVRGQAIGLIYLWRAQHAAELFNEQDLQWLKEVADRTALAIGSAQLYRDLQAELAQRRQAEVALREMAENMAAAQRIAHFGSWEVKLDEQLALVDPHLWSAECCRIFGYEPGTEITTERYFRRIHPDDFSVFHASAQQDLRAGRSGTSDYRIIRPDGAIRHIHQQKTVVIDEQSKRPIKIIGTAHDVTERKAIEDALRAEQDRLAKIAASVPGMIFIFRMGPDGVTSVPYCSAGVSDILALDPQDLNEDATPLFDRMHPDDVAQAFAMIHTSSETLVPSYLAFRVQHPEKGEIWVEVYVSLERTADGTLLWYGFGADITERKRTQEQIHYQANLLANVNDAVVATDMEFCITSWNRGAEQLYGWSAAEVIGQPLNTVLKSEYTDRSPAEVVHHFMTYDSWRGEATQQHRDGRRFHVMAVVSLVKDTRGETVGTVGIVQDITARKDAEAARTRLEEQLHQSQKMETIGRLAGGVAHDFNNLLTVIQGYSDMLLAQVGADSVLFDKLEQINQAGRRAANLTSQLLAFSRRQMLTPTTVDLNGAITNLQRMLERLIGEDILLTTALHPALWTVTVDSSRMEQVIMNLAVNARDAMPTGGLLTIRTSNIFLDPHESSSHSEVLRGPCVLLAITDTGCGMDECVRSQIFEPFFTTKEQGKGTGLGLSTVYGIVKQSGGDIIVDSEPHVGSTFRIYLPASQEVLQSSAVADQDLPSQRGSETVLLVEDEEMVRDLVQSSLEEAGYLVLAADSGRAALALAERHDGPIHLLMTDVVMPEMSGRELAEHFTTHYPTTKVLFTSGYTDDAVVRHGLLTAEVAFLQKPFTLNGLLAKVRAILDE